MESIVKCIELGAEDYLLKPFNSTLLKARINASLEKKHLRDKEDYYLQQIQEYNAQLEKRVQEHLQELKMARRVQTSLLPSDTPKMKEWEFAVLWIPAREIAGDYYDFVPEASGGMNLVIGDVTDKGLPASLFMVFARNSVRRGIAGARLPSEVMSQANRSICTESTNGLYITLVYALLEASGGKLTYVNAGHNSPLLYWVQKKELVELSATGMPLGVDVNATYLEQSVTMEAGDCLVLYTDGVVDALNSEKEAFGIDRLRKIVVCNEGESAENIIKAIETSLRRHVGSATWYDDVTIVVVKKL